MRSATKKSQAAEHRHQESDARNGETRGDTVSDEDLDISNEADDKRASSTGDDDEENQSFSLGSADNDNVTEGTP